MDNDDDDNETMMKLNVNVNTLFPRSNEQWRRVEVRVDTNTANV